MCVTPDKEPPSIKPEGVNEALCACTVALVTAMVE